MLSEEGLLLLHLFILYFRMSTKPDNSKSILVIVLGFSVLSLIFKLPWLLYGGLGLGILSLMSGWFESIILEGWFGLAHVLGWINTRILLGIIFYIFLTPIALLYRLFSGDPMKLKQPESSTFEERNHTYTAEDLKNQW